MSGSRLLFSKSPCELACSTTSLAAATSIYQYNAAAASDADSGSDTEKWTSLRHRRALNATPRITSTTGNKKGTAAISSIK